MSSSTVRLIYLLLAGLLVSSCEKEPVTGRSQPTFIKFFGGFHTEKAFSAIQTLDGGFVCVGTSNGGDSYTDIYVVKTDVSGNLQWERKFGGGGNDEGRAVLETAGGELVILGTYADNLTEGDMFLLRLDQSGKLNWEKRIGEPGRNEQAFALKTTRDGHLLLIGSVVNSAGSSDVYAVKLSHTGNIFWEKTFGISGLSDEIHSVAEDRNGNLFWCGAEYRTREGKQTATSDMRVILTRPEGSIVWDRAYGGNSSDTGIEIQVSDGGAIVVGTTFSTNGGDSDIQITKLFPDGSRWWTKNYNGVPGGVQRNDYGRSISPTNDGGYIVTGSTESRGEGAQDIYLLKIDRNGEEIWSETFGGKFDDTGNCVRQTADGGYMILGTITFENNLMMCLIKTNARGKLTGR
jgi:hypothetical protein